MPVPSRNTRDGTASTRTSRNASNSFCRGRPFFGRAAVCCIQIETDSLPACSPDCFCRAPVLLSRPGKEYAMSENNAGSKVSFFLVGLGIGALVGILFAPKSGEETREFLARRPMKAASTPSAKRGNCASGPKTFSSGARRLRCGRRKRFQRLSMRAATPTSGKRPRQLSNRGEGNEWKAGCPFSWW